MELLLVLQLSLSLDLTVQLIVVILQLMCIVMPCYFDTSHIICKKTVSCLPCVRELIWRSDYRGSALLREACLPENEWISGKFPKVGGGHFRSKDFIAIFFCIWNSFFCHEFPEKLQKRGGGHFRSEKFHCKFSAGHSWKKCFWLLEPVFWGWIFLIFRRNF